MIPENQSVYVCGARFTIKHAMICKRGGLIIQRHSGLRDLEAEFLNMLCYDVEVEPGLLPVTGGRPQKRCKSGPPQHHGWTGRRIYWISLQISRAPC